MVYGFWLGDYLRVIQWLHITIHLSLTLVDYYAKKWLCSVFLLTEMYICRESSPSFQTNFYNESQLGFV